jgi:type II secretory pathway component PulM
MWLPRPVYEALPYAYVLAGAGLLLAAFLLDTGPRNLLMVLGVGAVTVGLVFWMRRRDYRAAQDEYDQRSLDD